MGIAGFVIVFDVLSQETLSAAFTTAVMCPRRRPWVVASTAYLLLHLYHGIPDRYDPLRRLDMLTR
jgi:hypothetical protein